MRTLSLMALVMVVCGCVAPSGLVRTRLDAWRVTPLKDMGISLDLPRQSWGMKGGYWFDDASSPDVAARIGYREVMVRLHPVWQGSWACDPFYMVTVVVGRVSAAGYERYKKADLSLARFGELRAERDVLHTRLTTMQTMMPGWGRRNNERDHYTVLRRDYRAPDGDYVLCGASIYSGGQQYAPPPAEDMAAVSRILESVHFLDPKP